LEGNYVETIRTILARLLVQILPAFAECISYYSAAKMDVVLVNFLYKIWVIVLLTAYGTICLYLCVCVS